MKRLLALLLLSLPLCSFAADVIDTSGLRVSGNLIVNGSGQPVFIHGANRFDTTLCQQGYGHTSPINTDYTRTKMYQEKLRDDWNINGVRVMINEYCWRKSNEGVSPGVIGGVRYVDAMKQLVQSITDSNMVAIVTLAIVSHDGSLPSILYQNPRNAMPNVDYSIPVWREMANLWKSNNRVIFDLYNEPTPYLRADGDFTYDELRAWTCLRDGRSACTVPSSKGAPTPVMGSKAVGMQELLNTVRSTGSTNVVLSPGTNFTGQHERWIEFRPFDPLNNVGTSMHSYAGNFNYPACKDNGVYTIASLTRCVDRQHTQPNGVQLGTVIPIIWTEFGSSSSNAGGQCSETFFNPFVWQYARSRQQGIMEHSAFALTDWRGGTILNSPNVCRDYALFDSYGQESYGAAPVTASIYGAPYKAYLQDLSWSFAGGSVPPPPPPPPPPAPPPPPPPGDDQTFQVRNQRVTSKCLQPEDGSASVGDLLSAKLCNSANSAQAVTFSINSNGSARMIIGGLCVGSATGSFNNGSRLQLQACNGSTNQNFVSSSTRIAPFNAQGQVMDLHGGNLNDVIFWQDYGSINQRWNLSIVSGGVPPPDTTPDPFSFQAVTGAILGAVLTSNPVTIRGTTAAAPISVANGRYSIGCSGDFVSTASTISNDQAVCVQHDAASSASSSVTTMLNIGGVIGSFTSTTSAGSIPPPVDTTPDPFSFAASNGVDPGSTQISDTITISGINAPAPISVLNGAYSIGCAATFTSGPGTAEAGDTVCVRHSASTLPLTTVATTLAIGGVTATFTSETAGDGPSPAEPSFQVKNNWLTSKCLQPEDGVPSPGDLLSAKTCSATSAAQAVTFPANPNGSVRIMIGGLCAGSSNGSFSNGTRLQLQTCNSNGKQDFIRTGGRLSPASAQKQAMDLHGQDMNSVIFWQDFGGPNQRWTLVAR